MPRRLLTLAVLSIVLVAGCSAPGASPEDSKEPPEEALTPAGGTINVEPETRPVPSPDASAPATPSRQAARFVAPRPLDPPLGARVNGSQVTLSWAPAEAPGGVLRYEILVDGARVSCPELALACELRDLPEGRRVAWLVRAVLASGRVLEGEATSFRTLLPPLPPVLVAPGEGQRVPHDQPVTLSFQPAVDRDGVGLSHVVEVADETGQVLTACRGASACVLGTLPAGAWRAWRVVAHESLYTAYSPWATFRVNTPPAPVQLSWPEEGVRYASTVTPTLVHRGTQDADGDTLTYVAELRHPDGRVEHAACTGTECPVSGFQAGMAYEWRVHVSDGLATSTSGWRGFRINAPPTPPRPDPGDDGATQVPLDLAYSWGPSLDPEGDPITYTVQAFLNGMPANSCPPTTTPSCSLGRLKAGQKYQLVVVATDPYLDTSQTSITFTTRLPIVLIHGWTGDATTWDYMAGRLAEEHLPILDFHPDTPGLQLLSYKPQYEGEGVRDLAMQRVGPAIKEALRQNGLAPDTRVDIVAHSMGGLIARTLIEKEIQSVTGTGEHLSWANRVRSLTMVGTPNHGSHRAGYWKCKWGDNDESGQDVWWQSCMDMEPDSAFLTTYLPPSAPIGSAVRYYTFSGSDDQVVDPDSPRLPTVAHKTIPGACHAYHIMSASDWKPSCDETEALTTHEVVRTFLSHYLRGSLLPEVPSGMERSP